MEHTSKSIFFWLYSCIAGVVAMVLLGGLTRLSDSGLSITEWEVLKGTLPPLTEASWQQYFFKYQQIPEYLHVNKGINLQEFKEIFWLEYLHRLLGRLVGVIFFIPFIIFWVRGMIKKQVAKRLLFIFALGGIQGFFGWFMVSSGLSELTDVSHYRLALHLLTAFLIFAMLQNLLLDLKHPSLRDEPSALLGFSKVLIGMIFFMSLLGAFVAGTKAGFVYTEFPNMGAGLIPPDVYALEPWWLNHFENTSTIQFQHRLFALLLTLAIAVFSIYYIKYDLVGRNLGWALIGAVVLQIVLGVTTLHVFSGLEDYFAANGYKKIFQPAVIVAQAHQLGALLLLSIAISIRHQLVHKHS